MTWGAEDEEGKVEEAEEKKEKKTKKVYPLQHCFDLMLLCLVTVYSTVLPHTPRAQQQWVRPHLIHQGSHTVEAEEKESPLLRPCPCEVAPILQPVNMFYTSPVSAPVCVRLARLQCCHFLRSCNDETFSDR